MMGDEGGWWILMWVWMAVFSVMVVGGVIWFTRFSWRSPGDGRAREILDQRLASGDIEVDEHRRLKAELAVSRGARTPAGWIVAGVVAFAVLVMLTTGGLASGWDMMGGMHGGGRDTSGSSTIQGGVAAGVTIEDFAFQPGNLEVPVGATVTWTNRDSAPHDATARNGDWKTARLSDNESDALTFTSRGTFDYYCSIHPSMKARLVVR